MVFLPTLQWPLPPSSHMLSGGDFDGDEYLLFLDSYKMVPLVGGLGTAPQLPESQDEESEEAGRMAYSQQVVMMPDVDGNGRPSDASDQPTPDKPQPQAMSLYEAFKHESVPYLALPMAAGAASRQSCRAIQRKRARPSRSIMRTHCWATIRSAARRTQSCSHRSIGVAAIRRRRHPRAHQLLFTSEVRRYGVRDWRELRAGTAATLPGGGQPFA